MDSNFADALSEGLSLGQRYRFGAGSSKGVPFHKVRHVRMERVIRGGKTLVYEVTYHVTKGYRRNRVIGAA